MPAVCKFFLKGYCRFGSNCRYLHPGENDYDEYQVPSSVTNFSFRTPPTANSYASFNNNNNPHSQPDALPQSSGFSFKLPISNNQPSLANNPNDVDMSEGFSFRQMQMRNAFVPTQSTLTQNNNSFFNINNFHAHQQQHQLPPFSFNQGLTQLPQTEQTQFQNHHSNSLATNFNNNNSQSKDKSVFSDINGLTQPELEAFKRDRFEFCLIPVRPPPEAFC